MAEDQLDHDTAHDTDEEVGIPQAMRVKRAYTMSPKAMAQRQAAAAQSRPASAGNRNAFRHGSYAATFLSRIKPCKSTCPQFPCSLVDEGATAPGQDCLDKAELLSTIRVIHDAIRDPKANAGGFQEIASAHIANCINILEMLEQAIQQDGVLLKTTRPSQWGPIVDYKLHPALAALPKLLNDLNLTPEQFMITPKAQASADSELEAAKTIGELLGSAGRQLAQAKEASKGKGPDPSPVAGG